MYKIGDTVNYSTTGICRIEDIRPQTTNNKTREYYVLKPVYGGTSTVFVPADNPKLLCRMRALFSKEELDKLLKDENQSTEDITAEEINEVLNSGALNRVFSIVKTLSLYKKSLTGTGKHLRASDSITLSTAQKILCSEISYTFDKTYDQAMEFLENMF